MEGDAGTRQPPAPGPGPGEDRTGQHRARQRVTEAGSGSGEHDDPRAPVTPPGGEVDRSVLLALQRGTSQITWVLEESGVVRWVSPAVVRTLGHHPADLVGTDIVSLLHPDDVQLARALLAFTTSHPADGGFDHEGVDLSFDFRIRHRDGHWVTVENLANNLMGAPGVHANLVVSREAAGRHALDEALTALARDSAGDDTIRRLLEVVEIQVERSAIDAALYWPPGDPPWTSSRVPEALLVPTGPWVEAAATGMHVIVDDLEAAVREGTLPAELGRSAIEAGYLACWCFPVPSPPHPSAGYSYGALGAGLECLGTLVVWSHRYRYPGIGHWGLTQRVTGLMHLALSRRLADLEREASVRREQEQIRRLQELDAMKTDLVLSVSHELRTPLTSIISFAELLDAQPLHSPKEQAEYLSIIRRNAERLLRMVEDLLFLGRLESRTVLMAASPVDLPHLAVAAVEAIGETADGRGVTLELTTEQGPPLRGDPERLRQLLDNLLSNAVKYTGSGGWARVEVRPADGAWRVTVADNGIGVPEGDREYVFDRFVRGSNARQARIKGTGLGLAIARAVAELHHGGIELTETSTQGSTFEVTLRDI